METQPSKSRKRVSAPKVTTGCATCKTRRVKCDEGKPECKRCKNSGINCNGYIKKPRMAKPKPSHVIHVRNLQPLWRSPSSTLFNNNEEYGYFQRFCTHTSFQLKGVHDSELWNRVVLQATQTEPGIRHAVTAIGALDFQKEEKDNFSDGRRQEFAYHEYQTALVELRKSFAGKDCDISTKLISCLLLSCFESYHGNNDLAKSQVYAGIQMMEEHSKLSIESQQAVRSARLPPIDREIVSWFSGLEIQVCSWGDQRSVALHASRTQLCRAATDKIPTKFMTVKDASDMLANIILLGMHQGFVRAGDAGLRSTRLDSNYCAPVVSGVGQVLSLFQQWGEAFKPLYRKSQSPAGKDLLISATLLWIQYLSSLLWCACQSSSSYFYYRRYTRELEEIVELGKFLIDVVADMSFTFDTGIILPLAVVGLHYRHRATRREVIRLFLHIARREAFWNSVMIARILQWISSIEEEGLGDEEYIPEDRIVQLVNLNVDWIRKSAVVSCIHQVKGNNVPMEKIVHW